MFGEMFGELVAIWSPVAMLAWRDIRVRYKQSLLGVAWAFLMPLIQTAIWSRSSSWAASSTSTARPPTECLISCLSSPGMIPWTLFNATLASTVESLTRNSRLVTKIYFPREVFPLATVAGSLVDFGIAQAFLCRFTLVTLVTDASSMRPHAAVPAGGFAGAGAVHCRVVADGVDGEPVFPGREVHHDLRAADLVFRDERGLSDPVHRPSAGCNGSPPPTP